MKNKSSQPQISATEPDWSREKPKSWWDPSRQLLSSIRRYQHWQPKKSIIGWGFCKLSIMQHRFWSAVTGADIPINCQIGGGLMLPHPNGVVIHPNARIGPNCLFFQQVTVVNGVTIGGQVNITAGAKIIRPISIGDRAIIGANAVVRTDVPAGATAVGVPAKNIMPRHGTAPSDGADAVDGADTGTEKHHAAESRLATLNSLE
ncbi:MAG: serine O-acetyltransferase [Elainellaceae cyanobacterium]